jgi:UDP-N-acetylglucosamine--N-acetylmuramyl-(pentapeptide) pyrophosphoryl-undecaprenol N-acetylglucosamine transferase
MEYAFAAADVVVSRAGAMAIAELCVAGKPVIFVPYPYAAENHQMVNAMALEKRGAALVVKDSEVKTKLTDTILTLFNDTQLTLELKQNISKIARKDADKKIAEEILQYISTQNLKTYPAN